MLSAKFRPFCLGLNVLSIHGFGHVHESAYLVTLIQSIWDFLYFVIENRWHSCIFTMEIRSMIYVMMRQEMICMNIVVQYPTLLE